MVWFGVGSVVESTWRLMLVFVLMLTHHGSSRDDLSDIPGWRLVVCGILELGLAAGMSWRVGSVNNDFKSFQQCCEEEEEKSGSIGILYLHQSGWTPTPSSCP